VLEIHLELAPVNSATQAHHAARIPPIDRWHHGSTSSAGIT
jgi:hypothetical protein